ncbi:MAG: hypothetical protein IJZ23_02130 [Roseburia sp.]|nr:hypothetical protein [Roseburia sp.]
MAKLIICNSCGAEFSNEEPKCPYCGTMNYDGAEKEYFEKLEDIREDVEELNAVPMQETKAELKKQGRFIKKIVTVVLVLAVIFGVILFLQEKSYDRDEKEDFLWQQENYPKMNAMYEAGEYDELIAFYRKAQEDDRLLYEWEHADFVDTYISVEEFYGDLEYMESYEDISDGMYTSILWNQWSIYRYAVSDEMSEDEKAYFAEDFIVVEQHLRNDWDYEEATFHELASRFTEEYGYISWDECEDYIKEWKKGEK